jgi:hypothetical protein
VNTSELRNKFSPASISVSLIILVILNLLVIFLAQSQQNKLFYEVLYTARLTMFLFNIAVCLFVFQSRGNPTINKYWMLFWTASFIAYAVHVYYSYFLFFEGSISNFYGAQGVFVATLNLVITFWWFFDIVLIWFSDLNKKWVKIQRYGINILVFLAFFVSTVFLHAVDNKELFVIIMGYVLGISTAICAAIQIFVKKK